MYQSCITWQCKWTQPKRVNLQQKNNRPDLYKQILHPVHYDTKETEITISAETFNTEGNLFFLLYVLQHFINTRRANYNFKKLLTVTCCIPETLCETAGHFPSVGRWVPACPGLRGSFHIVFL